MFKKIISTVITGAICMSMGSTIFAAPADAAVSVSQINVANMAAPYDSITYMSKSGSPIEFYVNGHNFGMRSSVATNINISVVEYESRRKVGQQRERGEFEIDITSVMQQNVMYEIHAEYDAEGISYSQWEIMVGLKGNGDVTFLKSPIYDFNVERCSELWTDEQSLQECLQPQNDAECDDPYVIATAQRITAGCGTDFEKAFAIYSYIVNEFAYDYVQIEDSSRVYQDDARTLLRRKVAICEGMGNTFTALCRAAGVPAAISFGIGASDTEMLTSEMLSDEGPNHAWACVCLGGQWYHVDPTWDNGNSFNGTSFESGRRENGSVAYDWFLVPLESFSWTHKICDADTIHGIESTGSCGDSATYRISRDGTLTISGSGEVVMPYGVNGFRYVVFDDDCTVTSIGRRAFVDCDIIERVILPDTVTRIEDYGFNTCEDLEYIYLPDGLEYIGRQAFDYCDELAYVYIPDSVTDVGRWAFDDCARAIFSIPEHLEGFNEGNYVDPYMIIVREGA